MDAASLVMEAAPSRLSSSASDNDARQEAFSNCMSWKRMTKKTSRSLENISGCRAAWATSSQCSLWYRAFCWPCPLIASTIILATCFTASGRRASAKLLSTFDRFPVQCRTGNCKRLRIPHRSGYPRTPQHRARATLKASVKALLLKSCT